MKIAFWNSGFFSSYGGAELCTAELLNTLASRGETCFLLANVPERGGSSDIVPELDERIAVRQGAFHNPLNYRKNPLLFLYKAIRYGFSALALPFWMARHRVDVIHQHFISLDVILLVALKGLFGYRLVLTFHGMELELACGNRLATWKNRLALEHADAVTAVSPQQCVGLLEQNAGCNAVFIPNALDRGCLKALAELPWDSPAEPGHFVFCGRVSPEKQVPEMVEAFSRAIDQGCSRNLYIMGDGPDDERLKAAIEKWGLERRVFPLGARKREHALRLIRECHCLLLNSQSEAYPIVILEAMVLGRPVIAPDVGGIGEMLIQERNALLFQASEVDQLTSCILKMDRETGLAERLGENTRVAVNGFADLDSVVNRYRELYLA